MVDQAGNGTAIVVGKVAGTEGYVFIVQSDGTRHLVEAGEEVRIGQTLETLGGGAVVVTLANNKSFSLGQNQELTIDQRLIKLLEEIKKEDSLDEAINFDLIAQAFESGQNIEDILPATAAGGDNAPVSSSSAGASAARIQRTAGEVTPESGFETEALVNNTEEFNSPDINDGFVPSVENPAGNSRPITLGIGDFTVDQDQQYTLDLSQYFSDADTDQSLTYSVQNLPEGLTFDPATGIISGSPTNDSALLNGGAYTVVVTATDNSDSENSSVAASFNFNVNNLNDSPVAGASVGVGTVAEDTTLEISFADLLAGIEDIDGDSLSVTNISVASGEGALSINDDGIYIYTPSANWNGDVTFEYVIGDGQGGQVTNTAILTVTAVNDVPVAVNDGLIGMEINTSLTLDVLANDYDVDGDTLTITGVSAGQGTVTINGDGTVTYAPNQDFIGRDVLSYTISDGNGGEAGSLALVNIIVGNVAPVMADDASVTVPENTLEVGNFAASDADGDAITYSLSGNDASLFTIDANGTLSFISAPDFETNPGPFSVTITATDDGIGNLSDSQTLTISVSDAPENTAPTLGADVIVDVAENTLDVGNFAATDTEGNNITYAVGGTDAALFSIDAEGNLSFISIPDYEANPGPFNVTITATDDGEGALSRSQDITVNLTNVIENSTPILGADVSVDVAENTTAVGNFAATDTEGGNVSYTLSGTDAALFSIDAAGNLSFVSAPDYETSPGPFSVTVTATDDGEGTLSDSQNITINVTNGIENTAPVLGADTSVDVAENTTAVGDFAATDAESDNIVYSLSGADAALFTIDSSGNLSFLAAPDYETNAGPFNVTVTTIDDGEGTLSSSQDITVNVTNVVENTTPVLGANASVDVAENTTAVGSFAATDAEYDNVTYSLSGTDTALFTIDNSGNLSFLAAPDYETNAGPFNVTVTATDDGEATLSSSQDITVNITNFIENTAPVLGSDISVDVAENTTTVGNFAATDTESDNITYTLSGTDAALFSIDAAGNLSFVSAPDYETNPGPFSVTVTATDDGEGTLSDSQNITINVTNVIENTAPALGSDTSVDVAENTTTVGNFAAADAESDNITYNLSGADAALFTIDSSGNVSFLAAPDYEINPGPFNVTVTATDDGEGILSSTQDIKVNVTNVIENTAPVLGADASVDVAENTTSVGNFAASDAEGDNVTYSLSGIDAALFGIDASGNLSFVSIPDYETSPGPFNVTVTATDDGEATLSSSQDITVNVTNVIENTAPALGPDTSVDVAENATTVGNFAATDAENDNITYTLSGTDAALFSIDAAGNLSFVSAPDYETNPGPFAVTVTATDDGEGTLSDSQNITINITNEIENTAPVLGADTSVDVTESTTAVGNFAAADAESDIITYNLSGADAALFTIDGSGNLSFLAAPDYETNAGPFSVTVNAIDDGEGTLSSSQDVTINITNIIENTAPVLGANTSVDVAENTTTVGNFTATDAENDNITYSLSGADAALFAIDNSGNLSFLAAPDYETNPGPFAVTVTATDDGEGTLSDSQNITINITNEIENTAPVLGSDTSVDVAENTTAVGNFAATDAESDNVIYSLGGTNAALFSIDAAGNLSFVSAPDYEISPGPFSVTLTATDDGEGTLSSHQDITVSVTNVIENTAPVLGADASVDVAENTTAVGNFAATDAEDDNVTYSLSGTDAALFSIDAAGNLSFVSAPDYEANSGPFSVTVTATDDGEGILSSSQDITVNVTNVIENTAPALGPDTSVDVAENTTAVGNFAAADAENDNITYSLSGADAALFAIDNSGNLSFLAAPDYETIAGPFNVTITATDDGEGTLSSSQDITVSVTNVIENTAPVLGADASVDVAENTTAVGNFAATDAESDNITYNLSGADAALFAIDSSGNLSFLAAPDYETNAGPFSITVTATDDGEGALSSSQDITVNVVNVIENTAPVLGSDTSVDVAENTTTVGNFAATDAEDDNVTYSLSGIDAALFSIDASGNLSFVSIPDYETSPGPFNVTVTATDDGEGALSDSQNITINVTNEIENTAPVLGANASVDVAENTTAVGNFAATDAEYDNVTYSLSGTDAALFTIDSSGNLSFLAAPDYETNTGPFNVTVTATDDGEGTLSDLQNITINVTNEIENTAPVLGADTSVDVAENTTVVGNFAATDAEGENITYSLSGADAALFTMDSSGNLSFLAAPDYETNAGPFHVTVTAADDGEGALSSSQDITVNVVNVIENTAPVLGSDTSVDVSENTTVVGNFASTDTEGNNITYSLSGTDAALFSIDATGNLSFVSAPDYETSPGPFSVTVTATDDGEGALSSPQDITVNVTNLIENTAPVLGSDTSVEVAENTTTVGNFAAADAEGDNVSYTLGGTNAALFSIDVSGNLSFVSIPDYETSPGPFNVTVTATDDGEGTLSSSQNITINVTNVIENTAPVLDSDTSVDVAENTAAVGNFAATDAESDNITYSLSGADAALFTIDSSGNLSFLAAPDYEANAGPFSITVTATDDGEGALSSSQDITVSVVNIIENTAPVLGSDTSVDIVENTTVVGSFAASDTESDNITYTLSGTDAALFSIDAAGNLSFVSAADYETNPGPFSVTVTATDDGEGTLSDSQNITINITNEIENTAPVLGADTSVDVAENTTAVGNFAAADAEGDNITYSLSGAEAALFTIDNSGNLSFLATPDYETNAGPFNVTVTATDDGEGALSSSQDITVNITNFIENTAPVLGSDISVDVAENTTAVGNFAATDAESDNIMYSLSGVDAALFIIDSSGNLSFLAAPDYETNAGPFSVTVTATDDGEGALSGSQNITINVANVIENTAPVLGSDTSVDVAENTTTVGNFAATDAESDNITYSLSGADAGLFAIDGSGNLSFLVAPDFESNPGSFSVIVTATDDGEGALSDSQNITINVANVIENTAPVLGSDTSVDVAENTTTVGNFAATDTESDTVTYSLSGADAALFTMDSSGNLSFLVAPDYETNAGPFNVTVTATDDGEGALSSSQDITVSVTNVVENTAPVLGADASVDVAENSTAVGNFAATDTEGDNITYSLSGTDAALFSIDAAGNLSFASVPDFESTPGPFDVTVTATDDGEGVLSSSQNITVSVVNVNEPALIDLDANNSSASGNNFQANYIEGGTAVRVADSDISISDIDSTQLQSATVRITNVEAGDLLSAGTLPTGISASAYNPATGTITLSGTASLAAYQTAIRAIQFSNDGSASGSSRNIEVSVNDGFDSSNVATTTVNMVLVPTVSITDVSVQEPASGTTTLIFTISVDQALASDLTFNYNTADVSATAGTDYVSVGSAGTIVAGSTSTTIVVTVNGDANNFEGDETFTVNLSGFNQTVNFPLGAHTITDGVQGIGTIGANNGAPDAANDSFITSEDTLLVTGDVFSNDSMVDNADYASHDVTSTQGGTVTYNGDGTFTYTPASGFSGTDTFTYSVIDDDGEADTATVTVEVTSVPVNPPVVTLVPDTVYTENGSPKSLLSGISLSDIDSTTLSSVVVRVDGYIASQDALDYLTAGTSVNASIAASGNTWELTLTNGADINEYLSVLGSLTYHNASENPSTANRTITVEAYDQDYNNLFDSDSGTITVIAENDAPTVMDSNTFYVSNSVNNSLNINAPFDVDTDDATLVITVTGLPTSVGTVTLADGTAVNIGDTLTLAQLAGLQLDAGAVEGADTFTYTVFDGELTTVGTTTINVGDSEPDTNTVYESALGNGTGIDAGSIVATGNLFSNDAAADGSTTLESIEYGSSTHEPESGVITITTALGTLTVYADDSTPGFNAGDYEYVLNSADASGADIDEVFTYNFTSGVSIQDTLTVTVVDDQPVANNLVEDIPESEEQVFNLVFTLDISTSMNAEVGSTGQSRLDLAKQALAALAREYFDQSTQVNLTVLLFANGAHVLGTYDNFTDAQMAIGGVTDNRQTSYSNDLGSSTLSDWTSYNDALALIERELRADVASQNPADDVQNISYFLSDGAVTIDGSPIGNGFDNFVNSNSIDSYSVGIGTGLPDDLGDLNFIHNIDSLGQGNGHVDDALIVSDVSLLESELLSTVPTAFGGNITVDGNISNVEFGADDGYVSSISIELGGTLYTFTYDGSSVTVPGALTNLDVDGSKLTFNSDDGFEFGTFTFDFSDGSYLFIAPNGAAGSIFNFDFTVLDEDGDNASATATINIVDDRPDARDDLHTVEAFETAQGNVVTGIGTDGGPKLGTGFTEFASQGGGVDKVVDNATVSEFTFRGETISLDLSPVLQVTGSSADISPRSLSVVNASDFSITATRGGAPATLGYNTGGDDAGVGVQGLGQGDEIETGEVLIVAWDSAVLPNGVQNLVLDLVNFGGNGGNIDVVQIAIYDINGVEMTDSPFSQNGNNDTLDLSAFNGVGSIEITSTNGNGFTLNNIAYDPVLSTPVETGGTNGSNLSWTYQVDFDLDGNQVNQATVADSNDGSIFIMRSNGYYEYTPEALVIPPGTPVSESFADGSADQGITPSTTDNGSPVITFNPATDHDGIVSMGVDSNGDWYSDSADRGDNIILTFDSSLYPYGVQEIELEFGYHFGDGSAIFYNDQGEVIDTIELAQSDVQRFGGISGVRSVEIATGGTGSNGDYSIRQINFEISPNLTALSNTNEPITVDYVLTDSDGQSDTAQLAIHTSDNQITGTIGADSISGGALNDAIFGDDGDDILAGGTGHDTISGGAGIDIISGNTDSDYLSGGDGNDELYGGAENDHLAGDAGNDLLDGGLGDDIALGGDGNDMIFGGAGNDRLEGGAADDSIYGGAGNDILSGDDGDDIIFGGTGDDTLTGGDNIDTFVWQVTDPGSTDTITDFETGLYGDVLDFSDLLQGESADGASLDAYFAISSDGTDTSLQVDIDGDGSGTDMTVILQGVDLTLLGSEQQILQQLLDDGNLMTD